MSHDIKGGAAAPRGAVRILYRPEHAVGQRVRLRRVRLRRVPLSESASNAINFGLMILFVLGIVLIIPLLTGWAPGLG